MIWLSLSPLLLSALALVIRILYSLEPRRRVLLVFSAELLVVWSDFRQTYSCQRSLSTGSRSIIELSSNVPLVSLNTFALFFLTIRSPSLLIQYSPAVCSIISQSLCNRICLSSFSSPVWLAGNSSVVGWSIQLEGAINCAAKTNKSKLEVLFKNRVGHMSQPSSPALSALLHLQSGTHFPITSAPVLLHLPFAISFRPTFSRRPSAALSKWLMQVPPIRPMADTACALKIIYLLIA